MPNIRIPGLFWRNVRNYSYHVDKDGNGRLEIRTIPQPMVDETKYTIFFLPSNPREAVVLGNLCYRLADKMKTDPKFKKYKENKIITSTELERAKNDMAYFAELVLGKAPNEAQKKFFKNLQMAELYSNPQCPKPYGYKPAPNFLTQASCGIGKSAFVDLGVKPRIIIDELSKFTEPKTTKWSTNYLTKRKAAHRPGVVRWSRARTNRLKRR